MLAMTQYLMKNSNKVQKSNCTVQFHSINVGVVWGRGQVDWGCGNYRVWFVPETILEKLEPMDYSQGESR